MNKQRGGQEVVIIEQNEYINDWLCESVSINVRIAEDRAEEYKTGRKNSY